MPRLSGRRPLVAVLLGGTAVLVAATLIARAQPVSSMLRLILAVGAPYVALAATFGVALALWRRRSILAVATAILATVAAAIQVSWYYLGCPPEEGRHAEIRVLAANIRLGRADADSFVALAGRNADVITVAELTPEAVERFRAAGLDTAFRHSHLMLMALTENPH